MTTDKGNLAVLDCICKRDRTESIGSETKITSLLMMLVIIVFERRFDFESNAWQSRVCLHELDVDGTSRSSHLTTDKRTVAGESSAGQKWHNQ